MILNILNLIITTIQGLSFIVSHHIAESLYLPGYAVRSAVPVKDKKKHNVKYLVIKLSTTCRRTLAKVVINFQIHTNAGNVLTE